MQLKFKKICLLSTIIVYCASFLIQSNLGFFQAWAKEVNTPRVNIIAILVNDKIYDAISGDLNRYATSYIQDKLTDTKALVMPLDLDKIDAYDIYRMMQNIYFDGLKDVNSQLIGLIMVGTIPFPVVNQNGYMFPTVYPYVDFENPKYYWDENTQYFVPAGNSKGQAEIWHGLIDYGENIDAYEMFFENKLKVYHRNVDYVKKKIWYEDFIAQKNAFLKENFKYYVNRTIFGEDLGYQRYSPFMKKIFGDKSAEDSYEVVKKAYPNVEGYEEVQENITKSAESMHTTKLTQQEIDTSYVSDYNELFSDTALSKMRENVFAGGRWIRDSVDENGNPIQIVNADSSMSKIQLLDTLYLGDGDLKGILETWNLMLEEMIDKKINDNRYDMDIVIPVSYSRITGVGHPEICHHLTSHYDNYYFGNNARYIDKVSDLSVYRGTYRNLLTLTGVTYDSLLTGNNPVKGEYDPVKFKFKSIGASYGIFSTQVEGNRGYNVLAVERDLDLRDEMKTVEDAESRCTACCRVRRVYWPRDDDEDPEALTGSFVPRMWGGASPANLDPDSIPTGKYKVYNYKATDAWRPIFDMGGFQSLLSGEDEGMEGKGWITGGPGPQWAGTSFKSYIKYSSPTQRIGWQGSYLIYANHYPNIHKTFDEVDFFKLGDPLDWSPNRSGEFFTLTDSTPLCVDPMKERYEYKVIRSISKHTSTTEEELKGVTEDEINGIDRDKGGNVATLAESFNTHFEDGNDSHIMNDAFEIREDLADARGRTFHLSGMNLMTPDRPIDSPRYISMQSVAGNEIKFIYPDLFKVEVFVKDGEDCDPPGMAKIERHVLAGGGVRSVGSLNDAIKRYLQGKVDEYNKILEEECNKALEMDRYFNKLKELGYDMATPNTGIHGCGVKFTYKEFIKTLAGADDEETEKRLLNVIGDVLYYQNASNKEKLWSGNVADDINFIRKSYDVNDKRDEVLYRFLHFITPIERNFNWNYASSDSHQIVLPNHIHGGVGVDLKGRPLYLGGGGYEVAYVNSNNQDSLFPDLDYREDDNVVKTKDYANLTKGFSQSSKVDTDIRDECDIPVSGRLPIFGGSPTWLEGFKCWLKKTKEQPLKIKLSFDGSLGEVLEYDSLSDYLKNSDLGQSFDEWKDSMGRFADEWDKILDPDTTFDADKEITQMQVNAEKHNKEVVGANEGGANLMSSMYSDIKINNTNDLLSDSNPYSELTIESLSDIGSISVEFIGTGDGCLDLNGSRLEKGSSMSASFNPKTNPFKGVVKTCEEHKAGKTAIDIKMSVGGEYIEKVLKYTVSPSELERAEIKVLDKKTVAGMISPVKVVGYDKYNNVVDWGMEKYKFTTTQGRFLKDGAYQDSFITNDFRDLNFYLQVPLDAADGSEAVIRISNVRNPNIELADPYHQPIIQASPEIYLNGGLILKGKTQLESNQSHQLHPINYAEWASNITEVIYKGDELDLSILQKVDIDMKDNSGKLVDLDSQIVVTSNNGLVVIGELKQDENGKNYFFETNRHYMVDGHVTLYYYFSTVAGDEIINIDIPGLDLRKINLKITPAVADPEKVQVNVDRGYVPVGGDSDIEVLISDMYGNRVSGASTYDNNPRLVSLPGEFLRDMCYDLCVPCDNATVVIPNDGYLIGKAHGEKRGVDPLTIAGSENRIVVDGPLFPEDNLDVMYLNYFGDDRGNQWGYFSDNNKHMEKIMSDSIVMLAVTTQLISEDKIKRMMWKIQPKFQIANYDGISTRLSIKDGKVKLDIGGAAILNTANPGFTLMTGTQNKLTTILSNDKTAFKNYLFFIPNNENYNMDGNGTLYSGDKVIGNVLNGEITLQLTKDTIDNGDNIWDIVGKGSNFGSFVVHYPGYMPSVGEIKSKGRGYIIASTFSNGSTKNLTSVGVFDKSSEFELDTSYKSIQNSDEIDEGIGFIGDFKNITLFAEGEYVGEATRKFGSEFVINLGDPLLTVPTDKPGPIGNPSVPGGSFDGGLGNEIYVDTEKDIFKTYEMDFNNDGNLDLLVVYTDGTIKLSKSYSSANTPELRNMQELLRLAVPMEDVFVGDADGNGYDDIVVLTRNKQLRAYLNNGGVFDVDGNVACLNQNVFGGEISSTPTNLDGLMQIFVEDMNNDGTLDVVTYDVKGYVKVFFGGSNNGGPNYLSTEKYTCDPLWYARESGTMSEVTTLGLSIAEGEKIYDNSLITRPGLEKPEKKITEDELPDYGIKFNPKMLEPLIKSKERGSDGNIGNVTTEIMEKFNFKTASQKITDEGAEFVDVSSYDEDGTYTTRTYIPISFLDYQDIHKPHCDPKTGDCFKNEPGIEYQCQDVYKQYFVKSGGAILQDGDIVTVKVNVGCAVDGSSFIDTIEGPWNVYYDENGNMQGVRLDGVPGATQQKKNGKYDYTIDNIPSGASSFEYDLEYHAIPLKKISIARYTFYGAGPFIKVQSVDGCEKDFEVYSCSGYGCGGGTIELQEMIDKEYKKEEKKTEDFAEDVINMGSDVNQLTGIVKDSIDRVVIFDENGATINLDVFGDKTKEIETAIDTITKGMCNGFQFGGSKNCKGFPVPFNQAFLAPGKYHLFGCRNLPVGPLEGGIPVFFFPGTIYIMGAPVPFPWGLKGPGDDFLWAQGGEYPSFIRIYAAPTMTAQLGIAICMGKYMDEHILPSPLSDVAGNCIIFTVKPQCKSDALEEDEASSPVQQYPGFVEEVRDSGECMQAAKGPLVTLHEERSTPFNLNSFSANRGNSRSNFSWRETGQSIWGGDGTFFQNLYNNMNVDGAQNNSNVEYYTNFLGILEMETNSFVGPDDDIPENMKSSIVIGDVDILGGNYRINKIKGGIQQGIRKLIIDNRLDPQIRYIANQLTKMHVLIKFPDLSSLLDSEAQTMKNISQNIGTIWNDGEDFKRIDPVTNWSNINYDNLTKFNKAITNPFEALASLMNQSNIINISMQTLNVKVPMIFKEDIDAYEFYLQQWLEQNQEIVEEWGKLLRTFVSDCDGEPNPEACRQERNENLSSFIHFQEGDWTKMQNQIYANLIVLQKYREFPFEIYEWIHVIDRYMAEIAGLISNTIGYLSFWTSVNAERFAGYVDAIVLIINIIKTYQILIDFSVNWSENCGNCAKDTYDQYSCKLSFLCNISLPILQIPNFKLPNITIDLTDIDLSLDIVLPEFNFQPVRINLPELPNLPEPPTISLNIKLFDLPNIPVLPDPPELPELPSFIPQVELELPILPPAPEIPKIPNSLEALIDLGQFIGKIYCIVKGNFGLVGESSVKAKIEQLTQRTYEVDWIDNIMDFTNLSIAPIHNFGVDYEIDSIVDLQFSFTDFYDYLDTLTKGINNLTTSTVNKVNEATSNVVNDLTNPLEKIRDSVEQGYEADVDLSKITMAGDMLGITSEDIEYVDYQAGKDRLKDVLAYFKHNVAGSSFSDSITKSLDKIETQVDRQSQIEPNVEGIVDVGNDVLAYLDKQKLDYDMLADTINSDYDKFLAMVDSQSENKSKLDGDKLITFNVQLFNPDSIARDSIDKITKDNPYKSILDNKKTIIDGYRNAVNTNSYDSLGMTEPQYLVLRNSISTIRNKMNGLYTLVKSDSSSNLTSKDGSIKSDKVLVAGNGYRIGSQEEVGVAVDAALVSKGIYDKLQTEKKVKVVYSDTFAEEMMNRHYIGRELDMILWNGDAIFRKAKGGGSKGFYYLRGTYKKYYVSKTIKEIPYEETWIQFDKDTILKIADANEEVRKWDVSGQNYDVLYLTWQLSGADAYLIKLTERIDDSYEKADYSGKAPVRYILALPSGIELEDIYADGTKLELLNKQIEKIEDIYGDELAQITYYDPSKNIVSIGVFDVERKWYYSRIATLNLDDNVYNITSPWSNQIVAGRQVAGDEQTPNGRPILYRPSIPEVTSEGDDLEGYVGTWYKLIVNWEDNVALSYINISKGGKILTEKYTYQTEDTVSIDLDLHTKSEKEIFTSMGIDQFGNKTEKQITVSYYIPEITITDISKNPGGDTVAITAELSQDIDQGNVSFQRKRGEVRKTMKRKNIDCADLAIGPGDWTIIGSPYSAGNDIAMYDKKGGVIALMDPDTAEIKIQPGYTGDYEVNVKVQDSAVLHVCKKSDQKPVFSISLPIEECDSFEGTGYKVVDLPKEGKMGMFNGGKAVYNSGSNVLIVSPTCHFYSELGLEGKYSYDRERASVLLTLYEPSDISKSHPIKVWLKVKPFLEEEEK